MSSINVFNEIDKIFTAAAPKHHFSRTAGAQCLECDSYGSWCDTLTKCHRCGNEYVKVPDRATGEQLYLAHKRAEAEARKPSDLAGNGLQGTN